MSEATATTDPSHILSHFEDILDSDPQIDEVGFIHPMQFTALAESSFSVAKTQLEDGGYDSMFWHNEHKLGISTLVLVPLYRAARDAFMDAHKRYILFSESQVKKDGLLDLGIVESEVMKHSRALVLLSCDFGTAWNSRKLIVSKKKLLPMFMNELILSALVLSYSPKSERAWSHKYEVGDQDASWKMCQSARDCGKRIGISEKTFRGLTLVLDCGGITKKLPLRCYSNCRVLEIGPGFTLLIILAFITELKNIQIVSMVESLRQNKDPNGLSGEEFHQTWKDELDWVGTLIRRYVGREALWLHRRFLSLVWVKQHLPVDDDQSSSISDHSCCTSYDVSVFMKDEFMLLQSCINFPDDDDGFGDYLAQATHATTYITWLAKQMPKSFGAEIRKSSQYEDRLKLLLDDAGKSFLWNSMVASFEP
ncbi:hypothetical protein CASFOL_035111 [Castilleja foliolosa]|uniref:Uncharacterized protein n=1 Tax=Castilleja foliolosa TaxID=1961234 RepID=A0ABD3BSY1_9LAMI